MTYSSLALRIGFATAVLFAALVVVVADPASAEPLTTLLNGRGYNIPS